MKIRLMLVAFLAACLGLAGSPSPADLVPPLTEVAVTCSDPLAPAGNTVYFVDITNGGIDEPMTWAKPGSASRRGNLLVNAWRLRLGNGDVVVTSQPCSYTYIE